jgi:hypothetical protein
MFIKFAGIRNIITLLATMATGMNFVDGVMTTMLTFCKSQVVNTASVLVYAKTLNGLQ